MQVGRPGLIAPRAMGPKQSPLGGVAGAASLGDRVTLGTTPSAGFPSPSDLLPVPGARQSTTYSCGASALQAVLMYYGQEFRETELMEMLHTTEDGTYPQDIVRVAGELGLQASLRQPVTLDDLQKAVQRKEPVIVMCQAWREGDKPWRDDWEDGHYMVVVGMDEKNVYFEDPSMLGSRGFIERGEFEERWHDYDPVGRYEHAAIFFSGPKPAPPPAYLHVD